MSEFDARVFDLNLKKEENRRILDWDIADRGVRDCNPPELEATIATTDDVNLSDFTSWRSLSTRAGPAARRKRKRGRPSRR